MTVSEWHKIDNDGDPWQPTCWLQMAHNDDDSVYSQLIALRGMFPDTFQVCPSLSFVEKTHTQ